MVYINILSLINIAIICGYLLFRKNNILPNYILALAFLIPGLYFLDNILVLTNHIYAYPYAFFLVQIIAVVFPPSVYYYIHLLLTDQKKYHHLLALGSLLLLILICSLTLEFYHLTPEEQHFYLDGLDTEADYPAKMKLYTVVFYAWQLVYFGVLVYEIKQYSKQARDSFSNFEQLKLEYAQKFMLLLVSLSLGLVVFYSTLPLPFVDYGLLPATVSLINLFIIYNAVKHRAIFNKKSYEVLVHENLWLLENNEELDVTEETTITLAHELKLKELGLEIEEHLNQGKLTENPELRLHHLAEKLGEQPYLISQALNKHFGKSFFEVINEKRIKDAELKLKELDFQKFTIESLAFEVGFNSRAAFYRAFKKYTGKTPSEYLQSKP
jgi:AraC-like DNA-binding protein